MSAHAQMKIEQMPAGKVHVSKVRAFAASEFRRLADALESGELRGARIEWVENCARVVVVECDPWCKLCDAHIQHICKREVRMIATEVVGRTVDLRGDPLPEGQ